MFRKSIRLIDQSSTRPIHTSAECNHPETVYVRFADSFAIYLDAKGIAELKDLLAQAEEELKSAQEMLKPAEEVTRDLFNSSGIGVWEIDSNNGGEFLIREEYSRTIKVYTAGEMQIPFVDLQTDAGIIVEVSIAGDEDEGWFMQLDNVRQAISYVGGVR